MKRMTLISFAFLLLAMAPGLRAADTAAEREAIRQTALDYIEGYYTGDAARMERALHPELAKRIVMTRDGKSQLQNMTAPQLVEVTRAESGKSIPKELQKTDVKILDVFENAASVRIDAGVWIDYLHVAKWEGRWVIVNVLWELRPR